MRIFFLSACSLFIHFKPLNSQTSFSLQEAIQFALNNNAQLAIQRTDIADVDAQITEYRAIGMPKLTASVSYNYFLKLPTSIFPNFIEPAIYDVLFDEALLPRRDLVEVQSIPVQFGTKHNVNAGLEFNTLLFDGSFLIGLKAQKMYKELIVKQIQQSEAEIKYKVSLAYLNALSVNEQLSILQKNISNLEKVYVEMNEIYKAGLIEKLDVDRIQLSLQNLNAEKDKLVQIEKVSSNVLKFQMNFPLDSSLQLTDPLDHLLESSYIELMDPEFRLDYSNRPEYPVIMQGLKLAEINVKRFKFMALPSLYGFANYSQSLQRNKLFDSNDNAWFQTSSVGIGMNWNIFTGLDRKAKTQRAKVLLDKTKLQYSLFETASQLEFKNAKTEYLNGLITLDSRKKSMKLAEEIYEISKIKFREGIGSSLEVTTAERDLYLSQANLIEAQFGLIRSKINVDKSLGKL